MHKFEEEYKRRFKGAQSADGVDADRLWESIATGLEPEPRRKRPWGLLFWLVVLLFITGAVYYIYSKPVADPKQARTVEEVRSSVALDESADVSDQNSITEIVLPDEEETQARLTERQPNQTNASEGRLAASWTSSREAIKSSNLNPIQKQEETISLEQDITQKDKTPALSFPQNFDSTDPNTVPVKEETPTIIEANGNDQSVVASLPMCTSYLTIPKAILLQPKTELQPTTTAKSAKNWNLATSIGVLSWTDRYTGQSDDASFSASLAATHSPRGGFEIGLQVEREFSKSWSFTTGLQYQQVYNTFEWARQWDTVMYRNNAPGADLIRAEGRRRVKQQNELRWLNVPLLAGYQTSGEKWQFGLQAGLGLNYLLSQEGKSLLNQDTVFEFDRENTPPYQRFFGSSQFSPFVNYQLGSRTRLRFQTNFRYQWHGKSEVYELTHQSLLIGASLGVLFELE